MNKIAIIERAKFYTDNLMNGIEPVTGVKIKEDDTVNSENMKQYFSFISSILNEILINNGMVSLPTNTNTEVIQKKKEFKLNEEQKKRIFISDKPIKPFVFLKRLNSVVDSDMKKFSITTLNKFFLDNNYLEAHKEPTIINKTMYKTNELSRKIGLKEQQIVNNKTGEVKNEILFSSKTQRFIIDNIERIIENANSN